MPQPVARRSPAKPDRDYHHGNLRTVLVRTAEQLVGRDGAERVSLRAIARKTGVSHAALYHHFADRQALLAAVAASGFATLTDSMLARAESSDGPPWSRLQDAGVAYVLFAIEHPHIYRLMFSGQVTDRARYPELQTAADAAYEALGHLLRQTADKKDTREFGEHPASRAAWATIHGLAMLLIDGRFGKEACSPEEAERVTREVTQILGRGMRSMG
jgi:AcrR family transcriptional regulator